MIVPLAELKSGSAGIAIWLAFVVANCSTPVRVTGVGAVSVLLSTQAQLSSVLTPGCSVPTGLLS